MAEQDIQEGLSRVISQVTAAVTNTSLYSLDHPQVGQYIEKAYNALTEMLTFKPEITILVIGNDLVADNKPIVSTGSTSYVSNFIRILNRKAIERLSFVEGLPKADLHAFIKDLASSDLASIQSSPCIKLGKVEIKVRTNDGESGDAAGMIPAGEVSQEVAEELLALSAAELDELKDIYLRIKKYRKIDVRGVDELVKGFIKGFRQELNPLSLLASIKSAHEYTFTHVTNVCILAMCQAETLGFKGDQLHQIGIASLLHDVGKIFVPEELLQKPGKLTDDERKIIETHTVKGARFLMGTEGIPKVAVLAAMEHHLKYDGTGYPSIKGGWQPNIASQMISIADVFDAMRSKRSYQGAIPLEKIVNVLNTGKGKAFNPRTGRPFLQTDPLSDELAFLPLTRNTRFPLRAGRFGNICQKRTEPDR